MHGRFAGGLALTARGREGEMFCIAVVVGLLAPSPPPPPAHPAGPPPAPPNGTYVYALSRNGTDQGTTTVVVFRRDDAREIEVDEAGALGVARAHALAAYRYDDLGVASYVATYQAPFSRISPIGAARRVGTDAGFFEQTTVRYRVDGSDATASVDGAPAVYRAPALPRAPEGPRQRYVFDAPFMTTVLMLPAFRHRSGDAPLAPIALAFDANRDLVSVPMRLVRTPPRALKTPKTDEALQIDGVATLWFDRGNDIVHEAHFDALNIDARLVSYARPARPAPFLPAPTPAPEARLSANEVQIASTDGTMLAGLLDRPPAAKRPMPIVVFVPPGPSASRNFGGEGPDPMFPSLARSFATRGYAVLRYDTRGIGTSDGTSRTAGWDDELADAQAAIREAAGTDGVDPKRVFVAGYGSGADIALAAAGAVDVPVAGVVALAPTVVAYRTCGAQLAEVAAGARTSDEKAKADADFARVAGRISDEVVHDVAIDGKTYDRNDGTWVKTSYAHDPATLALRARAPLFVLHPGLPTCAETPEQTATYDERLRAANPRATIVVASDLSATFGGRYDADSDVDTEAFFPYRFDASTSSAIADWLDGPKSPAAPRAGVGPGAGLRLPPPPPPAPDSGNASSRDMGLPNPHPATPGNATPGPEPGQPELPSTLATPAPSASPSPRP